MEQGEILAKVEEVKPTSHYYYAQLNDEGICVAISDLAEKVDASNMILLDSSVDLETYYNILGEKYNGLVEAFEKTETQLLEETRPLTQEQEVLYNIQSNLEYLVCLQETKEV